MKCIALTYDDGPSGYTSTILDVLKSRRAVATFFVLGSRANSYTSVLRRAVNEQSEVANHTWSHPDLTGLSNPAISAQISGTDKAILKTAGVLPKLIRPPYGAYDSRVAKVAERPLALWTIDPQDWLHRHSGYVYHRVVSSAHPGGVVVMHDTLPSTLHATPRIIDELQRQGYVLVTMSELLGITGNNLYDFSRQILRGR